MRVSVLQPRWPHGKRIPADAECWYCHRPAECRHHIYMGPLRKVSEEHGFWVYLCHEHHNLHRRSVHQDAEMREGLQRECQREYEKNHSRDDFMRIVGKSYLED